LLQLHGSDSTDFGQIKQIMSIEDALSKIRPHTASQLPHQKVPAQLLVAMEDSFEERTPTAYFAATLSCLQTQLTSHGEQGLEEGDRLPAILYLLGLILPHVSPPVVRTNLSTTMNALTSLYPSLTQHAPALRSALSITGALLQALDRNILVETHGVKKLFSTLLDYAADGRPKVRKKAAEEIRTILETPPSPLQVHPYAEGVLKWSTSKLVAGEENTIHVVVFLRGVLSFLHLDGQPSSEVDELPPQLLSLTKLHNPHLEAAVYGVLSDLLSMSIASNRATITTLLNNVPSSIDPQLCSAWSSIFASITLPRLEPGSSPSTTEFLRIFQTLFGFLSSQNAGLQRIASESLSGFLQGNFGSQADLSTSEGNACVETILQQLSQALVALPYAHALPYTLNVLASTLSSFPRKTAKRKSKGATGDDTFQLVAPLVTSVSKLRISPKFIHKESADRVFVGVYLRWGAQRLLDLVPMNIEPSDRYF
jgi:ribosomal RNA-processing protein 12